MRLLIRLVGGTGPPSDLELDVHDDATIGELADHLAQLTDDEPGLTVSTDELVLDRAEIVAAAGPRSGSTIRLVASMPGERTAPTASPVQLAPPDAPPMRLPYGTSVVDGAIIEVGERASISAAPRGTTPSLNGERLLGDARLSHGDLVFTGARNVDVRIEGPFRPPPPAGPTEPVRRWPAQRDRHEPGTIELPDPPGPVRLPGFPVLSAAVPLLMGAGLWFATRSAASVVFVLFSFVFVVASGIESRREARAEARFREAEFRADLDERVEQVAAARAAELRRCEHDTPHVATLVSMAARRDRRLWERTIDGDGDLDRLLVRVGTAEQPAVDRVVVPTAGRRELLEELRTYAASVRCSTRPVTVDLDRTNGLAVIGNDEFPTSVARSVVAQLVSLVGPDDLAIRVVTSPDRADVWRWCDWLPHSVPGRRAARTVLVVDDGDPAEVLDVLGADDESPVRVLWLAATPAGLPLGIRAVLGPDDRLVLLESDGTVARSVEGIAVEGLSDDEALPFARSLAPLHPLRPVRVDPAPCADGAATLPDRVSLLEILADSGESTSERWATSARSASLGAPLGRADRGALNVDLRTDGPHALVAGTTGSGKSELLRTLISSLALHHAPDRLTFLLVDYKGGAAFGPLVDLPHTVGMITDLTDSLARRALRSLRAEVRRREEILAAHGVADLVELDRAGVPDRPPALAVVVDEFAALARELPEFVDGLVDVAQRGRSLGVHLVLATQRPTGVITDAIRANTTLRLALRVADEDDSRDVVDAATGAHLPRDLPGRAVIRIGPSRSALVQVAWSGGAVRTVERIRSHPLGRQDRRRTVPAESPRAATELVAAVNDVRATADGWPAPRRPWIDPLPTHVGLDELPRPDSTDRMCIGWIDRPDLQRRDPFDLDLRGDGGLLVLGANGSGRSTTLATVAEAAVSLSQSIGSAVHVHAIDAGHGSSTLSACRAVDDVLPAHDAERVLRLLRSLDDAMADRTGQGFTDPCSGPPMRVLLVDGFAAFEEIHERVNRGEAVDLLTRLARDGRGVGVHVVVAARRRSELPPSLVASLGVSIHLRCADEDDAVLAGLPPDAADPDTPPGRGYARGELVQIAVAPPCASPDVPRPIEVVPTLPRVIERHELASDHVDATRPWQVPIGWDADRLGVARLDLTHHHAVIAGPPRSGVSSTLATIAQRAEATFLIARSVVRDRGQHHGLAPQNGGEASWVDTIDAAVRAAEGGARTILAVDDLPELLDRPEGSELEARLLALSTGTTDLPLRIVVGGEVDSMVRCYSDALTRLRSGRTGVLLRPDPDLHPGLLHATLPARADLPQCAGRGWVVGPGVATPLQVALPARAVA